MAGSQGPHGFDGAEVLITGGLGFIGSNLAGRLVDLGARVTVADSLIPEYGGNLFNVSGIRDRIVLNISDVRDPHSMKYLVQGKDFLFNLAGQTSHMDSMLDPYTDLDINARSQLSTLEACRHHNPGIRVVFASTRQIYGKPEYLPVDEAHPINPVDVNGINKAAGEWYHLLYHRTYGIRSSVLRLTNTYGPRMRVKDARQTFLGVWFRAAVEGKPFEVWGGEQLRDFTFVDDSVEAFLGAALNDAAAGMVFNLGGEAPLSLRQAADLLVDLCPGASYAVREFPPDRKRIDIGDYYSDFTRINRTLGWKPRVGLRAGMLRTVEFLRTNMAEYL